MGQSLRTYSSGNRDNRGPMIAVWGIAIVAGWVTCKTVQLWYAQLVLDQQHLILRLITPERALVHLLAAALLWALVPSARRRPSAAGAVALVVYTLFMVAAGATYMWAAEPYNKLRGFTGTDNEFLQSPLELAWQGKAALLHIARLSILLIVMCQSDAPDVNPAPALLPKTAAAQ
jgi:hypothetical protein